MEIKKTGKAVSSTQIFHQNENYSFWLSFLFINPTLIKSFKVFQINHPTENPKKKLRISYFL